MVQRLVLRWTPDTRDIYRDNEIETTVRNWIDIAKNHARTEVRVDVGQYLLVSALETLIAEGEFNKDLAFFEFDGKKYEVGFGDLGDVELDRLLENNPELMLHDYFSDRKYEADRNLRGKVSASPPISFSVSLSPASGQAINGHSGGLTPGSGNIIITGTSGSTGQPISPAPAAPNPAPPPLRRIPTPTATP